LLSEFYTGNVRLNFKERLMIWLQRKIVVRFTSVFVFSTVWQKNLWEDMYRLYKTHTRIIENAYSQDGEFDAKKTSDNVLWIGRDIPLKNVAVLIQQ